MTTAAMKASMSAYSTAVAPKSSSTRERSSPQLDLRARDESQKHPNTPSDR